MRNCLPVSLGLAMVFGPFIQSSAAEGPATNAPSKNVLLTDRVGKPVVVSTNNVKASLHPPSSVGLEHQIPTPSKGASMSDEVRQRISESKAAWQWFPSTPPVLMPYLANLDEYGNTSLQPGAVLPADPVSEWAQSAKYRLSEGGLRYSLYQSVTMISMTDVARGSSTLQYYTATFFGKWALAEVPQDGLASWLSTEINIQRGLSPVSRDQFPQENLRTLVNPFATVFGPNGGWASELALQQSLADGKLVVLAGLIDQSNYIDANNYANNSQGQFMNSAFVNSMVLPFPFNNLGIHLQWQPSDFWYLLFGSGANNQAPGSSPFVGLSFENWSYLFELGLTPKDVLGLGPGAYRLQPFVATVGGVTQVGVGLNVSQQLGPNSPFAYFGRFGVGGSQVTLDGATVQIATGIVLSAPLKPWLPKLSNDYFGVGFVWSQPSAVARPVAVHLNEYGLETMFVLQLTPMVSLQPDFQVIWNPAGNPNADHNLIAQLQLNLTW